MMIRRVFLLFCLLLAHGASASPNFDYLSYWGGYHSEIFQIIALGQDRYAVLTSTASDDLPVSPSCIDPSYADGWFRFRDLHVSVRNHDHELMAASYLGGSYGEDAHSLVVLDDGDLIVSCNSSSNDLLASNDYSTSHTEEPYIARLSADLRSIRWSTRLGDGDWFNDGGHIAVGQDMVAVSWTSVSLDEGGLSVSEGVLSLLNLSDGTLIRSRRFPCGWNSDPVFSDDMSLYLTGRGGSSLATEGAYDTVADSQFDGMIMKLDTNLDIEWCTLVGGTGTEYDIAIDVAPDGSVSFACMSNATDIEIPFGDWGQTPAAGYNVLIGLIEPEGDRLRWAGWLGGDDNEYDPIVKVDHDGHLLVTGTTLSTDFPLSPDALYNLSTDDTPQAFLAKFDIETGALLWSSFLGDDAYSRSFSLAISDGSFAIAGMTYQADGDETNLIPSPAAFDTTISNTEGFILFGSDPDLVGVEDDPDTTHSSPFPRDLSMRVQGLCDGVLDLQYSMPLPGVADLRLYDLRGRSVAVLHHGSMSEGRHDLSWPITGPAGRPLPLGAYVVTLRANERTASRTIVIR